MKSLCLIIVFLMTALPALAAEQRADSCTEQINELSDRAAIQKLFTQASPFRAGAPALQTYLCLAKVLWQRGLIDDFTYFTELPVALKSHGHEDRAVSILRQALDQPHNNPARQHAAWLMASIYARPESAFYDPAGARHLYTQHYGDMYIRQASDIESCTGPLPETYENEAQQQALVYIDKICRMNETALLTLADRYEKGTDQYPQDHILAKSVYYYTYQRFDNVSALENLKSLGEDVFTFQDYKAERSAP